ncbi:DAK2 domain-containing protein [Bacillus tianshenii]|nr:DAK2 domain-containing protein [Bacillus tianshenii]
MTVKELDGTRLAEMIVLASTHLANQAAHIDALNVFPVPDGDTGTNMNLSMTSGANEVKKVTENHAGKVASSFARGLLMGARGNSGVILSQLFRGFAKAMEGKETITVKDLAKAFDSGKDTAYKAVMKPVEGTILTVAKDSAKKAQDAAKRTDDIIVFMEQVLDEAKKSLDRTPELLPVLKEVGVVDSGGQGLLTVYEGFVRALKGEDLPKASEVGPSMDELVSAEHHKTAQAHMATEDIEFGYCTEFMVKLEEEKLNENPFEEDVFRETLSEHGDSLLVVSDEELVKVHIHAEYPGDVLTYAQRYGSLINMKIENMREQHTTILEGSSRQAAETQKPAKPKKEYGIIAAAMGSGIAELLRSLGVSVVVEGGQTMNPSTEDLVRAIEEVHAEKVIILPNNGNIVMAATQAASVVDVDVEVVPSKTIPQGMSALLSFNPEASLSDNASAMKDALADVKTGQVTYAVRDTNIDGIDLKKGDFMGIADGKIVTKHENQLQAAKQLLELLIEEDSEIVTILQGEDAKEDETKELESFIEEHFEEVEVEIHAGKQPLYSYIFSVE